MGSYELLHRPDVPTGAVISEAVELAKRFSTEDSSRFVNGVLGRIAEEVREVGPAAAGGRRAPLRYPGSSVRRLLGCRPDREAGPVRPARTGAR